MDSTIHNLISERLDGLKHRGYLSEYLVAWKGFSGRLDPAVTVWREASVAEKLLEQELQWLLGDLVPVAEVTILQS